MIVEYHPAIQRELELIRDYYEERVPGLGRECPIAGTAVGGIDS